METNENFIRSWIGKKHEKMYPKMQKQISFNIWSALFLFLYFLYRKMYLIGFVFFVIQTISTKVMDSSNILIQLIVRAIVGISFYPLYKWDIQRKVRKLENSSYNYTQEQVLEMCKKKGGTSIVAVMIPLLIVIVLVIILMFSLGLTIFNSAKDILESGDINIENDNSIIVEDDNTSNSLFEDLYPSDDGENKLNKETVGDLIYSLPDGYKASGYNTETYSSYSNQEILANVYIYATPVDYYETTEDYVKQYVYGIDSVNDFETENLNGETWIRYDIQNLYSSKYCYVTKHDDKYYLVEFSIGDEEYKNNAKKHLDIIKNSLTFTTGEKIESNLDKNDIFSDFSNAKASIARFRMTNSDMLMTLQVFDIKTNVQKEHKFYFYVANTVSTVPQFDKNLWMPIEEVEINEETGECSIVTSDILQLPYADSINQDSNLFISIYEEIDGNYRLVLESEEIVFQNLT